LSDYASVVLVDVPARELSQRQMEALRSYVRDLGGGLVMIGGPTSYGVGGYYKTPIEDALPVEMQIKDQQRRPQLALVFIIDHSGSMGETSGGATKLDLAKEAAARSVELLMPNDRVGVIAFDDAAAWVVPLTELTDQQDVINRIGSIRVGGGTDIYAGVLAMSKMLPDDPAQVKHVILLTDGGADPSGIAELVKKLRDENNITLTTVGVGRDAAPFLARRSGRRTLSLRHRSRIDSQHLHRRNDARLALVHRRARVLSEASIVIATVERHHQSTAVVWLCGNIAERCGASDSGVRSGRSDPRGVAIWPGQSGRVHVGCHRSLGEAMDRLGKVPAVLGTDRALHDRRSECIGVECARRSTG
jgi:Mg-chelatase subunit ChlD